MGTSRPSRGWYVAATVLAATTLVVTALLAYGTATDLIEQVDAFQRFDAPGGGGVQLAEPGDYGVYYEYRAGGAPTGRPSMVVVEVTAPDGAPVEVRPSSVTYGWGSRQAMAVGEFRVTQPGTYDIRPREAYGRFAVGKRIPAGPLRGFGPTLAAASAVLVGCLGLTVVVAAKRRRGLASEPPAAPSTGPPGPPTWASGRPSGPPPPPPIAPL